ncbi:hypothetical protein RD792_016360 [Penstemon davidsonii]|uniref:Kinesin motor domain-containing protein n=1 Tax=Penstemon davidsonii TaxID=160366 RepID=A0ABR0CJ38_9LAMI|nr:hypothetical protein RD792_016360 [Penstemon davidsonii]
MGAIGAEELVNWEKSQGMGSGREEKILVLVRLRPLGEKEIVRNEVADWECINSTTILYRNSLQERSGLPTAYSFDRVFRGDCPTREVYDEGTKDIALSVVGGINCDMKKEHFVLKFSAMEIYNEVVRDLLSTDNTPLRLLDDPENFVDLAGSERASQALSVGQRLKEGCHINRSLLTLGTVIRKLR